jgi:hypothetical protein
MVHMHVVLCGRTIIIVAKYLYKYEKIKPTKHVKRSWIKLWTYLSASLDMLK